MDRGERQGWAMPGVADAASASAGPGPGVWTSSVTAMGTVVTVRVVGVTDDSTVREQATRAFGWFRYVEGICSRFDPHSEVMALCHEIGRPVVVTEILFGLIELALELAHRSRGAFDPTVGLALERAGFDRHYRTGDQISSGIVDQGLPTFRDVRLNRRRRTVMLRRPLVLDIAAVAKGLAIDLAARELAGYPGYAVEAGGDLYLGGHNEQAKPWTVGIRHPRRPGALIDTLALSDRAVCTSGDYERRMDAGAITHHLLDPRGGASATLTASATVIAPTALLADGLSTAAFVLGPQSGLPFLELAGAEGLMVSPQLEKCETQHYARYRAATNS